MAALTTYVSLRGPDGEVVSFGPGDDVPDWARKQITNPAVWDEPIEAEPEDPGAGSGDGGGDEPPPLAGEGSGRDAWAEYAAKSGVAVDADDKRAEIVAKLRAAGIRVE